MITAFAPGQVNFYLPHLFLSLSLTVGFLCILLCDELPQSDWYIHPSGHCQGKANTLLLYPLESGQDIFMHPLHMHKKNPAIFVYFPVLFMSSSLSILYNDDITVRTDNAAASRRKVEVSGRVLFLWHIHLHPANRRIQLHLRELLQHKIYQKGQRSQSIPFLFYTPQSHASFWFKSYPKVLAIPLCVCVCAILAGSLLYKRDISG